MLTVFVSNMSSAPEPADKDSGSLAGRVAVYMGVVLFLYLLPFFIVCLDEMVFKTRWIASHLSVEAKAFFRALYPFYKLFLR